MTNVKGIYWDEGETLGINPENFTRIAFIEADENDPGTLAIDKLYLARKLNAKCVFRFAKMEDKDGFDEAIDEAIKEIVEEFDPLIDAYILLLAGSKKDLGQGKFWYKMQKDYISFVLKYEMQREQERIEQIIAELDCEVKGWVAWVKTLGEPSVESKEE